MGKAWLGYLSSALILLAGILMIAGDRVIAGCFFIGLSIVSLVVKIYMNKKAGE